MSAGGVQLVAHATCIAPRASVDYWQSCVGPVAVKRQLWDLVIGSWESCMQFSFFGRTCWEVSEDVLHMVLFCLQ